MTDYKEAIKNLQTVHGMPLTIRLAIDALEKQIPKKPVRLAGNILFACPNDRWHQMTVDNSRKFQYCPVCGQRLDFRSDAE